MVVLGYRNAVQNRCGRQNAVVEQDSLYVGFEDAGVSSSCVDVIGDAYLVRNIVVADIRRVNIGQLR